MENFYVSRQKSHNKGKREVYVCHSAHFFLNSGSSSKEKRIFVTSFYLRPSGFCAVSTSPFLKNYSAHL